MVWVVLLVLVVLVVFHNIPTEPSILLFDFHQIPHHLRNVHFIIFLSMSSDFLRLSSGSHTLTITAKKVLPGIVEATPRLATPRTKQQATSRFAPRTPPKSHASHHATPPTSHARPDDHKELIYTGFFGKLLTSQNTRRPSGGR